MLRSVRDPRRPVSPKSMPAFGVEEMDALRRKREMKGVPRQERLPVSGPRCGGYDSDSVARILQRVGSV